MMRKLFMKHEHSYCLLSSIETMAYIGKIKIHIADIHAAVNHEDKAIAHSRQAAEINSAHFHRDHHIVLDSLAGLNKRLTAVGITSQAGKTKDEPDSRPAVAVDTGQGKATSSNSTAPAPR